MSGPVLLERLVAHLARHPLGTVLMHAAAAAAHGRVVEVMAVASRAGYRDIAIAADPLATRADEASP